MNAFTGMLSVRQVIGIAIRTTRTFVFVQTKNMYKLQDSFSCWVGIPSKSRRPPRLFSVVHSATIRLNALQTARSTEAVLQILLSAENYVEPANERSRERNGNSINITTRPRRHPAEGCGV
jgi:hypothetical protein